MDEVAVADPGRELRLDPFDVDTLEERIDAWSSLSSIDYAQLLDANSTGFRLPELVAHLLYERTWLRVVGDIIPQWGTKAGFTITKIDGTTQELLASDWEDLGATKAIRQAWTYARQHGGAGLVKILADGRRSHEPVDRRAIRRVVGLVARDRHELQVTSWGSNGRTIGPLEYTDLNGVRWHHSRVIPFLNVDLAQRRRELYDYWSVSEYERIYEAFVRDDEAQKALSKVVKEYSYDVLHLKDLDHKNPDDVRKALKAIALSIKAIGKFALGSEDKYTTQTKTISGLPDSVKVLADRLAMITRIPASILLFQNPGGINMGENVGDWETFFGLVESEQHDHYIPAVANIVADIFDSQAGPFAGRRPPERWKVKPNELATRTPDKQAEIDKANAERRAVDLAAGVVGVEEARTEARVIELYGIKAADPAPEEHAPIVVDPTAQAADFASTALNGAQMSALVDISSRVLAGELDRDAGLGILMLSLPGFSREQLASALPPPGVVAPPPAPGAAVPEAAVDGAAEVGEPPPSPGRPPEGAKLVSPVDLKARYGIGRKALMGLIRAGTVRAWKPGGRWRLLEDEVAEAIVHQPPQETDDVPTE